MGKSSAFKPVFEKDLIQEVQDEFVKLRNERSKYELQWQLNLNYLMGNQYCDISPRGEIEDGDKHFFWQEREIFNNLASIMETRLAKLSRVRPIMSVAPSSGSESDLYTAKLSERILNASYHTLDLSEKISQATMWSEACGTAFYKVVWNSLLGRELGKDKKGNQIFEGNIDICVCPPFEIFPGNPSVSDLHEQKTVIHARAYDVDEVKQIWGKTCKPQDVQIFGYDFSSGNGGLGQSSLSLNKAASQTAENQVLVLERYEAPCSLFPRGRLVIVAGDELLFHGDFPYENGADRKRIFPFVRQASVELPGRFWGVSVIERSIPIQRAYNAIKNRKHEFLNRISMGVLMVEDGSVDTDNLEEEGLSPGKVLVYRQGSIAPTLMAPGNVPVDFSFEEERLLREFNNISGVSELMRSSTVPSGVNSGIAMQLIIDQDDTRLSVTAEYIRKSVKSIGKHVLRFYKQFASKNRLQRVVGNKGDVEVLYFQASDISSDDVLFQTENEMNETPAQKRSMVFDLLQAGLLHDESGKLSNSMRQRALEMLGFGAWNNHSDISTLHIKKADSENLKMQSETCDALEVDDHDLHIHEHTSFLIEKEETLTHDARENFLQHIRQHKLAFELSEKKLSDLEPLINGIGG